MTRSLHHRPLLSAAVALLLAACQATKPRPPLITPELPQAVPPTTQTPQNPSLKPVFPDSVPDAVPRVEPKSRYGNPPFYDVLGHRYYVLSTAVDYVERGVASWYGPGFHEVRTSSGDTYDMYGMSAAHKTLPLPAYVRVTNLQNGRSVVVRVNDRGPFVGTRLIDLSYTAAAKLDMLRNGTAFVEVRAIDPSQPAASETRPLLASGPIAPPAPPTPSPAAPAPTPFSPAGTTPTTPTLQPTTSNLVTASGAPAPLPAQPSGGTSAAAISKPLYVQAGAFSDPANAERLVAKLRGGNFGKTFVRDDVIAGRRMYRVRIGPVPTVADFDRIVTALDRAGVRDAHLAMD